MGKTRPGFVVGTTGALRGLLPTVPEEIRLVASHVPEPLWALIPYAQLLGIQDDILRAERAALVPPEETARLKALLAAVADDLDAWLAGPEADGPTWTDEYLAFSALRITFG